MEKACYRTAVCPFSTAKGKTMVAGRERRQPHCYHPSRLNAVGIRSLYHQFLAKITLFDGFKTNQSFHNPFISNTYTSV
jgi:hypothetical protein